MIEVALVLSAVPRHWDDTAIVEHAVEHRIDPHRIGLAGASGGGAPAAATALMVRDRHAVRPCSLSLLYPMLDDRLETPSSFEAISEVVFARPDIRLAWSAVLGGRLGTDDVHPYSAPGRATHLADLPDTFVAVAQFDLLRDEGIESQHVLANSHATIAEPPR
jgi:acetyl esterase/lipase